MEQQFDFIGPKRNWLPLGNRELLLGVLVLVLGFFGANMVLFGGFRLGFAIAGVLVLGVGWGYLRLSGHKGDWYSSAMLLLVMVITAGFGWSSDVFVKLVMLAFVIVCGHLALCLMTGQNRYAPGGFRSVFDGVGVIFSMGFGKMNEALRGVKMAFKSGGEVTRRSGAVLAGLGMAIPALAVVIPLLMASDAAFEGLIDLLPDFNMAETVYTVFCGSLLGVYLFSLGTGLHLSEKQAPAPKSEGKISPLTMHTALGMVCGVYVVYLLSQLAYLSGGFAGILPEGYTAAEYARRGFFEMTWLCGINLGLIGFAVGMVQKEGKAPLATRVMCAFLGLVTLFLVAASCAKMVLYIGTYGLTRLRVLTMVIMAFLAAATVLVCVWLFVPKLQYMKAVILVGLSLGAAVIWADVDTQVAKYNVEHYLSGDLENVDVHYLKTLGPGMVPYLEMLTDCDDVYYREWSVKILADYGVSHQADFREMTGLTQRAREILEQYQKREEKAVVDDVP